MIRDFLPLNKKAAVCFSIDDIHPGKSTDYCEAGGDLEKGSLGLVEKLLQRHGKLKLTVFLTADWRMTHPFPTRNILAKIPIMRNYLHLAKVLKKGTMRLRNHPEFVSYLKNLPRTEVAFHGLHHCHKGLIPDLEFQEQSKVQFSNIIDEIAEEFLTCGLEFEKGLCPPNWLAPKNLLESMIDKDFRYLASARDLFTPVAPDAKTNMSGLKGVSLIYPEWIVKGRMVHIPANFNATRRIERAIDIIENGGILSIKAHIVKSFNGYLLYDGVDEVYMNYLDTLLTVLKTKYGDQLWFATMGEIAERCLHE